ncbi:MAG: alcohol dehydrogenase catalytic domain-containing protein [Leptospiraceae bacterium]
MKRLELVKKGTLEWREFPEPEIQDRNQLIVAPVAVARCDLDLPILHGKTLFRPPFAIGHEFVGKILKTSPDLVDDPELKIGTLVAVSFQVACGSCSHCSEGLSKSCSKVDALSDYGMPPGANHYGGALTEQVLVPFARQMCLPLPASVDPVSVASLSDNIAEADKLVGRFLPRLKDKSILVLGGMAQSIGIYTCLYAKQMGQTQITYMDDDPDRLQLASNLGIECLEAGGFKKSPGRYHLVADASANESAWNIGLRSVQPGGIYTSASIFWSNKVPIPYLEMYNHEVELHIGRVNAAESMRRLMPAIESGQFTPESVVTHTASFADAKEAWSEPGIKLVIKT